MISNFSLTISKFGIFNSRSFFFQNSKTNSFKKTLLKIACNSKFAYWCRIIIKQNSIEKLTQTYLFTVYISLLYLFCIQEKLLNFFVVWLLWGFISRSSGRFIIIDFLSLNHLYWNRLRITNIHICIIIYNPNTHIQPEVSYFFFLVSESFFKLSTTPI